MSSIIDELMGQIADGTIQENTRREYLQHRGQHRVKLVSYDWVDKPKIPGKKNYRTVGPSLCFEIVTSTNEELVPGMKKQVLFNFEHPSRPVTITIAEVASIMNALFGSRMGKSLSKSFSEFGPDLQQVDKLNSALLGVEILVVGQEGKNPKFTNLSYFPVIE